MTSLAGIFKWVSISTIGVMSLAAASLLFGTEIRYLYFEVGSGVVALSAIGYAVAWSLEKPPTEEK